MGSWEVAAAVVADDEETALIGGQKPHKAGHQDAATTEFCFDAATGFLERSRTWAGSNRSGIDLLRVFDQEEVSSNGTGRVATERSYGGDPGGLDTGELCSLVLPDDPQSQLEHTYAHGALASSSYVDPCDGTELLKVADHDIDANTGLVEASRDSAGVATSFVYDSMARLVRQEPEDDAWTVTTYDLPGPTSSALPKLTVRQCANGTSSCSGAPLAWRQTLYDGLGRLSRELIQYPSATGVATASRDFGYNAMGWKTSTYLWNANTETTKVAHDRFGRVRTITPPDTSLAPTVFRYRGEQRIERSDKVATGEGAAEAYICYREEYDTFGRLVSVSEDLASNAAGDCSLGTVGLQTLYAYDESDRLTEVCAGGGTPGCDQQRFFNYDNRGFLTSEQHPEIGLLGNGVASYTYDASGNVLSKDISGTADFALRYSYDLANRLIAVDEVDSPTSTRPIKSFHYARANDEVAGDLKAGKLVLSKRVNWVDPVGPLDPESSGVIPVTISRAYRYQGEGGRVSERQTRYNLGGSHNAFVTGFTYDDLGNLNQIEYPRCLHYPCAGLDPPRTVDFAYNRGFLSSVTGFADSLTYQRGGMLHEVTHANQVVETIKVDPVHPFDRPYQITTTGVTSGNWDSGVYEYDGSGNVKKIGAQLYRYDKMSRLLEGQVEVGAETKDQVMTYDAFGNILSLTTDGVTLATQVTGGTNRLTNSNNASYDAGGNLTGITLSGEQYVYTYDPLNMMKHLQSTADQARVFLYDADDERVMTFDCALVECDQTSRVTTTIRGLDGKVLRVYNQDFGQPWDWVRDYVYRGGQLLASVEPDDTAGEVTSHLHLDHLGSPRQITDDGAIETAFHAYYPFGGEATDSLQDEVALKFTGHERDENGGAESGMLDYMHARYCSPVVGRFLSVDSAPRIQVAATSPQMWNLYTYAANNPSSFVDPNGEFIKLIQCVEDPTCGELALIRQTLTAAGGAGLARQLKVGANGDVVAVDESFEMSRNNTVSSIARAINEKRVGFRLEFGPNEGLKEFGGALTKNEGSDGFSIRIDAELSRGLAYRMRNTRTGAVFHSNLEVDEVFMHEVGHFFATSGMLSPTVSGGAISDERAIEYENLQRQLKGGLRSRFERFEHDKGVE